MSRHKIVFSTAPFSLAAVAAALFTATTTVLAVIAAYSPLPIMDQWEQITIEEHLATLFALFNEHRLFIPRLFFMADILWSGGDNRIDIASILGIQVLHAGLLTVLGRAAGLRGAMLLTGVAASLLTLTLWGAQLENLAWGFQVQFVGVYTAATAAFLTLALAGESLAGVVLAILFAGTAVYSMANGVLVPPLLVVLALWLRRPHWQTALLVIGAAALLTAYLWGYRTPSQHSNPLATLSHVGWVVRYTLTYLGGPFAELVTHSFAALGLPFGGLRNPLAVALGGLGVLALGGFGLTLLLRPNVAWPARLALLHIALFIAGTAGVTALGRATFPLEQAFSSRYATPAIVFWAALLLLGWGMSAATDNSRSRYTRGTSGSWAIPVILLPVLAAICASQFVTMHNAAAIGFERRAPATALLTGIIDRERFRVIYPDPNRILHKVALLEEQKLSVFAQPWALWRGTPLTDHVALAGADACIGSFDTTGPVPDGGPAAWRVNGWAWDNGAHTVPKRLVLTDGSGRVVGYAISGSERHDVAEAIKAVTSPRAGWNGHAATTAPETLTAYALVAGGTAACPLPRTAH